MAFVAGHILMASIQFKPGIVVVELHRLPAFKSMAFQAHLLFIVSKLSGVYI